MIVKNKSLVARLTTFFKHLKDKHTNSYKQSNLSQFTSSPGTKTAIFAHRGSKGTHPENTLVAFQAAILAQTDGIELDVHLSADGHLIVIHDETVDRTTNGTGLVRELTLEQIKSLDAGSWFSKAHAGEAVPTLEEVLALLVRMQYKGVLNIEIKTDHYHYPGIESQVEQAMQGNNWPFTYIYCSFNLASLEILHQLNQDLELCYLMKTEPEKIQRALELPYIKAIHPHINWVYKHLDDIKDFPKIIRPWVLNDERALATAFSYELEGLMTDFPHHAKQLQDTAK